jgi:hypothetical protein
VLVRSSLKGQHDPARSGPRQRRDGQSWDDSSEDSSDSLAAALVRPVLRLVWRGGFALVAAERDVSWDSSMSACSRASLAASLSSLFLLRSLATVRSSFATWVSSSALFSFGARAASVEARPLAVGFVAPADFADGGFLALVEPGGRPGPRLGVSSPAVARGFRDEVFVARAMIVSCCGNVG